MKNTGRLFKIFTVIIFAFFISLISISASTFAADISGAQTLLNCPASVANILEGTGQLIGFNRIKLVDNIYEYKFIFKVGANKHDKIGVYRVIKEKSPWEPISTLQAIMMLPGDASSFCSNFLKGSNEVPADHAIGIYLAQKNIDVWGMDFRWAFVSDLTFNLSFMKDWNTALHLKDIKTAVTVARKIRGITGSGMDKIFMSGMSRGAQFVYAYANEETQIQEENRDIKGIIPLDMIYKIAPDREDLRQAAEDRYLAYKALYDTGTYYNNDGGKSKLMAILALSLPNAPSQAMPGLTNKQAALFMVSATYGTFVPPMQPYTPQFHYLAGTFDDNSMPTGLQFTNYHYAINKILSSPGYQSLGETIDGEAINSDIIDTPYDDHLEEITVPVFYVGTAGGYGDAGLYTLTLLGSTDTDSLIVTLYPPEYVALDFGHADLLWADNAQSLVWEPIYNWIANH